MARKKKIDEKEQQVSFASLAEIEETAPKEEKKTTRKKSTTTTKKKTVPKKDRKINITQEDMDKLCEVYDWYLSVKDTISYNAATEEDTKNKDVVIEETDLKDTKKAYLDRQTWEDFDVLCSNCGFKKNEVLTQIIKDFLREHRNLF